jgi:hypothetical protein
MVIMVYYKWEHYHDSSKDKFYEVMKTTCIGLRNIFRGSTYRNVLKNVSRSHKVAKSCFNIDEALFLLKKILLSPVISNKLSNKFSTTQKFNLLMFGCENSSA